MKKLLIVFLSLFAFSGQAQTSKQLPNFRMGFKFDKTDYFVNPFPFLMGSGAPANTLGIKGDMYLDTDSKILYGPKSAPTSGWGTGISFKGDPGSNTSGAAGQSAYQLWINQGNTGTITDFINSLKGTKGDNGSTAYQLWLNQGNTGTLTDFQNSLKGVAGQSAYQLWLSQGNTGSLTDFQNAFKGTKGDNGYSAYQLWLNMGNSGTLADFMASLKGSPGNASSGTTDYTTLINKPTKVSDFSNDANFQTQAQVKAAADAKLDTAKVPKIWFGTDFGGLNTQLDKVRLSYTGVAAGTYGSATKYPSFVVGADGRITLGSLYSLPVVPTNISTFNNDAGYTTATAALTASRNAIKDSTLSIYFGAGFTVTGGPKSYTVTSVATGASVVVDAAIVQNGTNPVSGGALYNALLLKQNVITFDAVPTAGSGNLVQSGNLKMQFDLKAALNHLHDHNAITDFSAASTAVFSAWLTSLPGYVASTNVSLRGDLTWVAIAPSTQTQLATPTLSGTAVSATQINVSWTTAPSATGYTVFNYLNATYTTLASSLTTGSGVTTASFTGLTANTPYYLRVKATAPSFADSQYGSVTVSTNSLPQLATPTLSSTATGPNTIASSWTSVTNATTYVLERAPENTFSSPVVIYSGPNTSVPGTSTLTAATTYYYRIHAEASGYANSLYGTSSATTQAAAGTNYLTNYTALSISDNQSSSAQLSNNSGVYSSTNGSASGNNANPNQKMTGDGVLVIKASSRDVQFGFSDAGPGDYGGIKAGGFVNANGDVYGVDYTNYTASIIAAAGTYSSADFFAVRRVNGVITVNKTSDGVNFTPLYTNQLSITTTLYPKFIVGISPSAVYYPQGLGFTSSLATPTITNVAISGTATQGNTLTATYTATGTQGTPKFQWYHADNTSGLNSVTAVAGTASTFVVGNPELSKYDYVVITPTYTDGTMGTAVASAYTAQVAPNAAAPTLLTGVLTDATHVTFTFDRNTTISNAGLGFVKNGTTGTPTVTGLSGSGTTTIVLTLSSAVASGNTLVFNYAYPWVGSIKSTTGGYGMGPLANFSITNNL